MPYIATEEIEDFTVTWDGKENTFSSGVENGQDIEQISYSYSFEVVTTANKDGLYPTYEVGENIATIEVSGHDNDPNTSLKIQASIGINSLHGTLGKNSLNESWFGRGSFDQDSFNNHVLDRIVKSVQPALNGIHSTILLADLPDNISGLTHSNPYCDEVNQATIKIDTRFLTNPNSDAWLTLGETDAALFDRETIFVPAHEAMHATLDKLGIPPHIVGEEAIAHAYGFFVLDNNPQLWHTNKSDVIVRNNSETPFFENSNLRMEGTGTDTPFSGYEHFPLVEWLMASYGLNWETLLSAVDRKTVEEQQLGCPLVRYINPLERVFDKDTWNTTMGKYLGEAIRPAGSQYDEIFGNIRNGLDSRMKQLRLFEDIVLQPDYFSFYEFYNYIHLPSNPKTHLILKTDQDIVAAFIDNDNTIVLGKNEDLAPYLIDNPDGGRNLKIAILNPNDVPLHVSIEPVRYDHEVHIPLVTK